MLPRRVRAEILLRSLAVQGSWNYETLIGTGFAFTILPALRHIHRADPEALQTSLVRHAGLFNSHPYFIPVAAGAVARLEEDDVASPVVERFKSAIRGSLGSVGDQLVWWAWRPMSAVLGVALLLAGAAWWIAVIAFLTVYNTLHVGLRIWGMRIGLERGMEVGRVLRDAPLHRMGRAASNFGLLLAGFATVLAVARVSGPGDGNLLLGAGAVALGIWLGLRARTVVWAALGTVWGLGMLFGTL
ncbi:MAG TPA: PTS system mannose/fructose/sorbose family transporter subunit IID [Longimicrobiaceae bacterium]|nr:PTS system mannose/fructose/sorbose family transporter subunit IID [Longimicrobiaceae bacterium]